MNNTGLLAGLKEFPTDENVSVSSDDMASSAYAMLENLLQDPPSPKPRPSDAVLVSKTTQVGDVLHVFSHIRKTYRVQWVQLVGGDQPPSFLPSTRPPKASIKGKAKPKAKAGSKAGGDATPNVGPRWCPLEEIDSAKYVSFIYAIISD